MTIHDMLVTSIVFQCNSFIFQDTPSLGLLIEGTNDTVDASAETPNDKEASHFDFCDTLPPHIASGSSSAGR